jgi:Protein of unknown function (DUF2281).
MCEKKSKKKRTSEPKKRKPIFEWRGCLTELRDKYSSVELQHKIVHSL